ncbi:efflux RND transporter periplasmic adaptor subunit [Rhizobium sp. LjRoot30]|uniref:efflux RND transporter periplasmic adaptor subunit n=1 Tax=Rhizobium sp. LjRoot30 TaxID=3342320 RepID=UPI003ECDD081
MTIRPAAAFAVVSMLALAACSEEKVETKEIIRPVKVVEISATQTTRDLDYSGSVKARTEMNLGFRVAGKITERLVDVGDRVKPGDALARVDAVDYGLLASSAQSSLDAAERQVETTKLSLDRAEKLFRQNVSPKSQLEQAQLAYNQAVATRDSAKSALEQAKNQIDYTTLSADRDGIVVAVNADSGQVVSAGTPVVTVAVDGEKEVQIAVPETEIAHFEAGKAVKATFWSDAGLVLDGKVREVAGSADQASRTFAVRVSLSDDPRVRLGMTATVNASAPVAEAVMTVPLSALAKDGEKSLVWIVDRSTGTVRSREVKVAGFAGDGVRIAEGLKVGDAVVAAGTQFMSENLKVKLAGTHDEAAFADKTGATELLR